MKKNYRSPLSMDELGEIVSRFRKNEIGVFPTDTVYGVGCLANASSSTGAIYNMKRRETNKPLPILIGGWDMFNRHCGKINAADRKRLEEIWPGALTVIVRCSRDALSLSYHCQQNGTIAMRMPDHASLRFIIEQLGIPLAATSANVSGGVEALSLEMVSQELRALTDWGWSELIPQERAIASSIVDLTGQTPSVLRQGKIVF